MGTSRELTIQEVRASLRVSKNIFLTKEPAEDFRVAWDSTFKVAYKVVGLAVML